MKKSLFCNGLASLIITFFWIFAVFLVPLTSVHAQTADTSFLRGQKLFKKCVHCHTYKAGQKHRIGPNLFGMFGRKAGNVADFDFSDAWKNADFIWTDETLDTYLLDPHKMIPNNQMPFDGLSRANDRKALITYLKTIVRP
jgi:cytochrome c